LAARKLILEEAPEASEFVYEVYTIAGHFTFTEQDPIHADIAHEAQRSRCLPVTRRGLNRVLRLSLIAPHKNVRAPARIVRIGARGLVAVLNGQGFVDDHLLSVGVQPELMHCRDSGALDISCRLGDESRSVEVRSGLDGGGGGIGYYILGPVQAKRQRLA